jgi:hypothetical protein
LRHRRHAALGFAPSAQNALAVRPVLIAMIDAGKFKHGHLILPLNCDGDFLKLVNDAADFRHPGLMFFLSRIDGLAALRVVVAAMRGRLS